MSHGYNNKSLSMREHVSIESQDQANIELLAYQLREDHLALEQLIASFPEIEASMEAAGEDQAAMEQFSERLKQIVQAILSLLRNIRKKLSQFFHEALNSFAYERARLQRLGYAIDDIDGKYTKTLEVPLGNAAYGISSDYGTPTDGRMFLVQLQELQRQMRVVFTAFVPTIQSIGRNLGPALASWSNGTEPNEWLDHLNRIAAPYNIHAFAAHFGSTSQVVDTRYPVGAAKAGRPLPGLRSVVFMDGFELRKNAEGNDPTSMAIAIQTSNVELVRMNPSHEVDVSKSKMETMPPSMMRDVHKALEDLLAEAMGHDRPNTTLHILEDLERSVEHIQNGPDVAVGALKRGLQYVNTLQRWSKIHSDSLTLIYSVIRASTTVTYRHVGVYNKSNP